MARAPQRSASGAPSVHVEAGTHAAAGSMGAVRVHARNVTVATQELTVSVVGLEADWSPTPAVVLVAPDATVTVELVLTPPAGAAVAEYPFVVLVEAADQVGAAASGTVSRTVADASIRVDGASELVLSVEPADARAVRARRVEVVLANTSHHATTVRLAGQADEGAQVIVPERAVEVGPQQTVRVPVVVRVSRLRVMGPQRRHTFTVTATGRSAPQRVQGTLSVRALFSNAVLRGVAMVTIIGLWVAGALVVLPRVTEHFAGTSTVATSAGTAAPGATEGGQGSDSADGAGDGAGAGGGDGSGGADGAAGASSTVRGAGLVTGVEPERVRVQLIPTSSLWTADATSPASTATAPASTATAPASTATASTSTATAQVGALTRAASAALTAVLPQPVQALAALTVAARGTPSSGAGKVRSTALAVERTDVVSQRLSTLTGSDGTWAFGGLSPSARYLVVLSKPGFQTQRVVLTGAELAAAPLEIELRPGDGSLSGLVTGPDGAVGGVEVTITDGTTTVTTRTATSGQVGRWQVDGLTSPTTYLVTASSGALGAQSVLVGVGAAGAHTVDLALRPGVASVSGTVVGTDSLGGLGGLGGLSVTASDGTTTRTATTVTGEGAGVFVLPDLPAPGTYTVTVAGEGYATVTQQLELGTVGVQGWEISVGSVGGSVQGTVKDALGAGVEGAGLVLTGPAGTYKTMSSSDGSGTYRFAGIAPGEYVLSGEAFGFETGYVQVGVRSGASEGADLTLVAVPNDGLVATAQITGRVTDASTGGQITCPVLAPTETCQITATVTASDLHGVTRTIPSVVDPDDPYRLPPTPGDGLLPGRYTVTVEAPGYEPGTVQVTVPMGGVTEAATVALKPSPSLVGTVLARAGVLGDACVVAAAPGVTVADPCGSDPAQCASANARCVKVVNGSYQLDRLRAGTYVVTVVGLSSDYVQPAAVSLTLAAGDVRRYDVTVERRGIINVNALRGGAGGSTAPADGTWISATRTGSTPVTVQANTSGYAQLRGLDPGTWTVSVSDTQGGAVLRSMTAVVGLNQEITVQLVVTTAVGSQVVAVVTQLRAGHQTPVDKADIKITGTVGYEGVTAVRRSATFRTVDGLATVCTAASGCTPSLALVDPLVDVEVTHPGFVTHTATGVTLDSLGTITLTPAYATFAGSVVLSPADSTLHSSILFDVVSSPPGVGAISLSVAPDGVVTFTDSAQSGSNRIRPGEYTVVARLTGHTSASVTFVAEQRGTDGLPTVLTPAPEWKMPKNGRLAIKVMGSDGLPVSGALVRLHAADGPTVAVEAVGTAPVDFGDKPSGAYEIDVLAAGYTARTAAVVTLPAGSTYATPVEVELVRLGTVTGEAVSALAPGWTQALPGATVTATRASSSFQATTGSTGRFSVTGTRADDGLAAGLWSLTASAPGHTTSDAVEVDVTGPGVFPVSVSVPPEPLRLVPEPSTLTVTVVDGLVAQPGLTLELRYSEGGHPLRVLPCATLECQAEPSIYRFEGLLPLTYSLFVSGGGYLPMNVRVAVTAGEDPTLVIPITAPAGSLQGMVAQKGYGGSLTAVEGRTVVLTQTGLPDRSTTTDAEGAFAFLALQAGAYQVHVRDQANTLNQLTQRVSVISGQSTLLTFELEPWYGSVVVEVRSTNGADLSGALVTLAGAATGGSTSTFGPQPVVRAAGGGNTFVTTFNQVPTGSWTASVTGPAGHHGTFTGAVFSVPLGAESTSTTVDVTETELVLRAQGPAGAPSTVQVQVTPTGLPALTLTLVAGASDTVVRIPVGGAVVTATATGGWVTNVSPSAVGGTTTHQVVTVTLTGAATTTTATTGPGPGSGTVTWGGTLPLRVTVAADGPGGGTPSGEVQVTALVGGVVTVLDQGTLAGNGTVNLVVPTADLPIGPVVLTVAYGGAGAWGASSTTSTVTVEAAPTATTWTTSPPTTLVAGQDLALAVAVARDGAGPGGPPTGTVSVSGVSGGPVTATLDASGRATLTVPAASLPVGTHTVVVTYGAEGRWAGSAVQLSVRVDAAPVIVP